MRDPPAYFEEIRRRAAERWDRLEKDPELAGPWHQLFKQVQSPRHVLSELLQNADDAGATDASARIVDGTFVFEHNGTDFEESHFQSLCRFGYSNKRALHTIGFRGIGFKSTFSLGGSVVVTSPSLSVRFDRKRFTEPIWVESNEASITLTRVSVVVADTHRLLESERNLAEWQMSPLALLFFRNLRRMRVGSQLVEWTTVGPGPVLGSEWVTRSTNESSPLLLVRSDAEPFPEEALREIRDERLLGDEDVGDFPPCRIEIVLGSKGRLHVVLPTGVLTDLPFACNAPFIQDPARVKLKDLETSPTNRWLLSRAGVLAAHAMLDWAADTRSPLDRRAEAYALLPDTQLSESTLEGSCANVVEGACGEALANRAILLTDSGRMVGHQQCSMPPDALCEAWSPDIAAEIFDPLRRPPLSRQVSPASRAKLVRWGLVSEIDRDAAVTVLQQADIPKPTTWRQLLVLWNYVAPALRGWHAGELPRRLRIVPVQGSERLFAATDVVRLGESRLLQSDEDWNFFSQHLRVLNQNWTRFLTEQRREAGESGDRALLDAVESVYVVLQRAGLQDTSDASAVVETVASAVLSGTDVQPDTCVRLAHIAARLDAAGGPSFRFLTREGQMRPRDYGVLADLDGSLEPLVPDSMRQTHVLATSYQTQFRSCSKDDWFRWVNSGRAGLLTFAPIESNTLPLTSKAAIEREVVRRGGDASALSHPFRSSRYEIEDWDFPAEYWTHWQGQFVHDEHIWAKIGERVLLQPERSLSRARTATARQLSAQRSRKPITSEALAPSWVLRLRQLPCLPDNRGIPRRPDELLLRTPRTESLLEVTPFVHGRLDKPEARWLLNLLGVGSAPSGPRQLLDCVRALAASPTPPAAELDRWYGRLDHFASDCTSLETQLLRDAFRDERLILSEAGAWVTTSEVFVRADETEVPGAALLRSSVRDLSLWPRLGVAGQPRAEFAFDWLRSLPSGATLSKDDARRVKALLGRYPARVWNEIGHWISLASEWQPTERLRFALSMPSLVPWSHLDPRVKQETADLQSLPVDVLAAPPFSGIALLLHSIQDRVVGANALRGRHVVKEWLSALGSELERAALESAELTARIRDLAIRLRRTHWVEARGLMVTPYVGSVPAGTPRRAAVVWIDDKLFVDDAQPGKLAKLVPDELARTFGHPDIRAALDYSYERPAADIRRYMAANFTLSAASPDVAAGPVDPASSGVPPRAEAPEAEVESSARLEAASGPPDGYVPSGPSEATLSPMEVHGLQHSETAVAPSAPGEQVPPPTAKPVSHPLIDRFAFARGFRKDGPHRFFHPDGRELVRAEDLRALWALRGPNGSLRQYLWPKEHCLEQSALEINADIWRAIEERPDIYSLLLMDPQGTPIEIPGARLREMRERRELTLYPASYRIVYGNPQEEAH